MVVEMTLKELRETENIKYTHEKFGDPPLKVGNTVWVKVFDNKGIFEMPVKIIEGQKQTCLRCGSKFYLKSEKLPKTCPNPDCKSPYWNKPLTKWF